MPKIFEADQTPHTRTLAQAFYLAYTANSDNKSWDGRDCPTWDALTPAVRSHWCAVAVASQNVTTHRIEVKGDPDEFAKGLIEAFNRARE